MTDLFDKTSTENSSCISRAKPGEPMFVLMGRDPAMAETVAFWAARRLQLIEAGHIADTPEEREHVAKALRMVQAVMDHQIAVLTPTKQSAYAAARVQHTARVGRAGRLPG